MQGSFMRRLLSVLPLALLLLAGCDSGIPDRPLPALGTCEYTVTYEDGEVERYEHRAYVGVSGQSPRSGLFCDAEGDGFPLLAPYLELGGGESLVAPIGEPFRESHRVSEIGIPSHGI